MTDVAVSVCDLAVRFRVPEHKGNTVKELAIGAITRQLRWQAVWALRGVSFDVRKGETLAVVGANGAGKSTLIQALSRVLIPTEGRIVLRGHPAPMTDFAFGDSAELTGYENIVLYGALLGRDPRRMRQRAGAIAESAGVSDLLHAPLRVYSLGMRARLAFALAIDDRPDILLIDEGLSVGDSNFRQRAEERMAELAAHGTAVILVSHVADLLRRTCERAIWLERGALRLTGGCDTVLDAYLSSAAVPLAALGPGHSPAVNT